jgi:hypothetical protein
VIAGARRLSHAARGLGAADYLREVRRIPVKVSKKTDVAHIRPRAEPGDIEIAQWSVRLSADESADLEVGWMRVKGMAMERIILDTEAGQVSAELVRCGIAANVQVHALVEVKGAGDLSTAAIAQAGGAFDWLADEPDLYTDADLVERAG